MADAWRLEDSSVVPSTAWISRASYIKKKKKKEKEREKVVHITSKGLKVN